MDAAQRICGALTVGKLQLLDKFLDVFEYSDV
jgi:hypothetical protein